MKTIGFVSFLALSLVGCGGETRPCDPSDYAESLEDYCNGAVGPINYTCDAVAMACTRIVTCSTNDDCADHFTCALATDGVGTCNRSCITSDECQTGFACDASHLCSAK